MNTYKIDGTIYQAPDDYRAMKLAYPMADSWVLIDYRRDPEAWTYLAIFRHGRAVVVVDKIR